MSYENSIFSLGEDLFTGLKKYVLEEVGKKYPNLKITTYSTSSTYPQIVFSEERNQVVNQTSRNELIVRKPEFEINIYAKNDIVNNIQTTADDIVNDISNVVIYYLEKICKIKDVNLTSRLTNFDDKNVQSRRAVIRFSIQWLKKYNIRK